ncbi:hypothetical protein LJC16_03875, partial [Bacteroidales bacterium OttesenSCG-928-C19]|nr:hypothetical protein [Bacteroidales bacterium OttesenSCG-928-C19]
SETAKEKHQEEEMLPKYMYWEALAFWKNGNQDTLISIFEEIIAEYPESEIIPLVKSQLELFKSGKIDQLADILGDKGKSSSIDTEKDSTGKSNTTVLDKNNEKLSAESELYRFRENTPHYVVIILNDEKINGTQLSYKVSDFNQEYFSINGLKTSVLMFSQNTELINVERFADAKKAMEYYEFLQQQDGPLNDLKRGDYTVFAVSVQNYKAFYSQKNVTAYEDFFRKFYF